MTTTSLVVLDEFYDDPHEVRAIASAHDFRRSAGVTYPGVQASADHDWEPVRRRLASYLPDYAPAPSPKTHPFPQGMFRLATAPDESVRPDGVHQDAQRWSSVIYLSLPRHCAGGVAFYRHRETGAHAATAEWEKEVFGDLLDEPPEICHPEVKAYFKDLSHWVETQRIEMRFNRAVLLMAQCFHGSIGVFGTGFDDGRLTQHFEFYA